MNLPLGLGQELPTTHLWSGAVKFLNLSRETSLFWIWLTSRLRQ
jgi:hypothetical protein